MNQTVLLVDDSDDDIALIRRSFSKIGCLNPIQVVRSGFDAISYLKGEGEYADRLKHPFPGIILLDLHMPGCDGFEVLKFMRNKLRVQGILIIVLSRLDEIKNINRAYSLGAHSFLMKPGDPDELYEVIKTFHGYWMLKNKPPQVSGIE